MANVRVYNDHPSIDFEGTFKDEKIVIPAGEYQVMGRSEAMKFLGEFSPIETNGRGEAMFPKRLRMWEDPEERAERMQQPLKFTAIDGKEFRTKEGLLAYEATFEKDIKEVLDGKPTKRKTV